MSFLSNLLKIFSGLSPVFALLLYKIPFKKERTWFILFETFFIGLFLSLIIFKPKLENIGTTVFGLEDPLWINNLGWLKISPIYFYPLFIAIFLLLFYFNVGFQKALPISVMLGFLLTEYHEIPIFLGMYFGAYRTEWLVWFSPLNHLYSVVVTFLVFKISNVKFNVKVLIIYVIMFVGLFAWYGSPYLNVLLKRIWVAVFFMFIFYFRVGQQ